MFRLTVHGSTLKLLDNHLLINQNNRACVDNLFSSRYDFITRQEEVSHELNAIRIESYQTSDEGDKTALPIIIDNINTLPLLVLPAGETDKMKRRFLRMAVSGADW